MYGRCGDAERALGGHAGLGCPLDARYDVAHIVETAEYSGYVDTLGMLHPVHQTAHVVGHRIHSQGIEAAVKHVGLDADFIEWLAKCSHGCIRVLTGKQVDLLKCTAVGLHTGKAAHVNYDWSDALQLVLAWLELSGRLPHVAVNETELDSFLHNLFLNLNRDTYPPAAQAIHWLAIMRPRGWRKDINPSAQRVI